MSEVDPTMGFDDEACGWNGSTSLQIRYAPNDGWCHLPGVDAVGSGVEGCVRGEDTDAFG
jgi:hypothetical protein